MPNSIVNVMATCMFYLYPLYITITSCYSTSHKFIVIEILFNCTGRYLWIHCLLTSDPCGRNVKQTFACSTRVLPSSVDMENEGKCQFMTSRFCSCEYDLVSYCLN